MPDRWGHDFEPGGYYGVVRCVRCGLSAVEGGPHTWCQVPPPPRDFGTSGDAHDATPEDVGSIFDRALSESPFDRLDRIHKRGSALSAPAAAPASGPPASGPQHDLNCEWQFEQYGAECTCGVSRPRAAWFAPWRGERS
jgi:hypothetical protein